MAYTNLNPQKALIWRIIHRDNLLWILKNGIHCANSNILAPNYVNIGNLDLIDKRRTRLVSIKPKGTLADYVPFYFTPFSVMMMNIHSGRSVKKRDNEEIVILVSSLHHLSALNVPFVFTNAHAYPSWSNYYDSLDMLDEIDWQLLQNRDFRRDPDDLQKIERYQAEALVYKHIPVEGLLGVICYTEELKSKFEALIAKEGLNLAVHVRKNWYFQ